MIRSLLFFFALITISAYAATPVTCKRTFSTYKFSESGEIVVSIEINKGAASGIAKLVEDIPFGLKAYEGESVGGVFTFEQQKMKIVWLNIPAQNVIKVSYKLKVDGELKENYHLVGRFLYVVGDKREEVILSDVTLFGKVGSTVSAQPVTKISVDSAHTAAVEVKKSDPVLPPTPQPAPTAAVNPTKEEVKKEIATLPANSSSETYKVQLGAFSTKKEDAVFNGLKDISSEQVNGMFKYYTGSFNSKADAEARVAEAKAKGFSGAYVVSFKDGKRVK